MEPDSQTDETVWLELRVEVDREAVESVSELFTTHGYQNGIVVQEPIIDDLSWGEYVTDPDKPVTMLTYIREDEAGAHSLQAVREGLWHLGRIRPVGALSVVPTREQEWTDTWKAYYRVLRVGERVVIKPSWLEHEPAADDLVIDLDPGLAFGTGLHPTTRLCLRAIEQEMRPGRRALDLGSGSGILSVLLAKMGATEVVALDTDRVAVDATEATARRNGVERVIHAGWGSIEAADGEYDFVAANIVANVIIGLAAPIAAKLAPGGVLVVSGIIEDRYDEVALALAGERLRPRALLRETDWVAIVADRPTEEDEQH